MRRAFNSMILPVFLILPVMLTELPGEAAGAAVPAAGAPEQAEMATPETAPLLAYDALLEVSPLLDEASRAQIGRALARQELEGARVGVLAVSLRDGAVLLRKNSSLLLNPASNAKLATSAAALVLLGPHFRYATFYASDGAIEGDTLTGNLYVQGRGDPTITTERLLNVVHELKLLGIRRINGTVVVDDSYFDADKEAKGWEQEDSDRAYAAPVGALSLNYNTVGVYVRPGASEGSPAVVVVDPPSDYIDLDSRVTSSRFGGRVFMRSYEKNGKNVARLWGHIDLDASPRRVYRRVVDPALHFGHALAGLLNDEGIRISRRVRRGYLPDGTQILVTDRSPRMSKIVSDLNKWSNNFIAEQLIKTMGAVTYGQPGTFAKGLSAARQFLEDEVGWARGGYVFENGSGLNDVNRFSPEQVAQLLDYMYRNPEVGAEYVASLGVAGRQGTIAGRLRHTAAEKRLRAKTGTLTGVSALSGYVTTASNERIIFSIMVNGFEGSVRPIIEIQDMIGEALAAHGSTPTHPLPGAVTRRKSP